MARLFRRTRHDRRDVAVPGSPLESLLEEMHDLRLTLAADLTAAAGAAEAGAEHVAREIIEADQVELARFARIADLRLTRLSGRHDHEVPAGGAWRRRIAVSLPVVPVVGAMAFSAAAATGVLSLPGSSSRHAPRASINASTDGGPVTSTFRQLVDVLGSDPSASQVIAAADKLHQQLRALIETSPNDPGQAAEIAALLRMEQSLLMQERPPGADVVLSATRKLAARLVDVAPQLDSPSISPTLVPSEPPSSHHPARHATSSSPAPQNQVAQPSPTASAKPPAPSPSSSPSPSTSPFPAIPDN